MMRPMTGGQEVTKMTLKKRDRRKARLLQEEQRRRKDIEAVDRALADRLGRSAALHAERHYTFDHCVDRYEALYKEVLSGVT